MQNLAILSTAGVGILANLPTDPETIEALAKWPAVVALAAVAIYSIYTGSRAVDRSAKSLDRHSDAILDLTRELSQRPCIRNHDND